MTSTTHQNETTYNLTELRTRFAGYPGYERFCGITQGVARMHSLRTDIEHSVESFEAVELVSAKEQTVLATAHQALICNGIILYARATITSSDHRKSFDVRSFLSATQLSVHEELCGLRNDAVAHYGPGHPYQGEWFKEAVMLQIDKNGEGRVAGLSRRLSLDAKLVVRAIGQSRDVREIIVSRFHKANAALVEELNQPKYRTPEFAEALNIVRFNLADFLGSQEAAQSAFQSREIGKASGTVTYS